MMSLNAPIRPGTTLIELLLFMAILGIVGISALPLLFSATEDRLLQQTISNVEQNGVQLMQTIGHHVRHAEKIVNPAAQSTTSILTLQTGSGDTNPTVIGISSGALILIRRTERETISSSQVAVESFTVQNTSASAGRDSVLVRFRLSRTIRLQAPRRYIQTFESVFTTFPDDAISGDDCACAQPGCGSSSLYVWQVCNAGAGQTAQSQLQCP